MPNEPWVQNPITIETDPAVRLWTGQDNVAVGPNACIGSGPALSIGEAETRAGEPGRRMTITLSGIPLDIRGRFLQDVGLRPVIVEWTYSRDLGASWIPVPVSFRGRLSTPATPPPDRRRCKTGTSIA